MNNINRNGISSLPKKVMRMIRGEYTEKSPKSDYKDVPATMRVVEVPAINLDDDPVTRLSTQF